MGILVHDDKKLFEMEEKIARIREPLIEDIVLEAHGV